MKSKRGFTLLEMLVTVTVLMILASAVQPIVKNRIKRQKELELRRSLREIRQAIDNYKKSVDSKKIVAATSDSYGYPATLEVLVEGEHKRDSEIKVRFLRRIPIDPFIGKATWGLCSITDSRTSTMWGGGNVYDVYSLAPGIGSDNIPYREW